MYKKRVKEKEILVETVRLILVGVLMDYNPLLPMHGIQYSGYCDMYTEYMVMLGENRERENGSCHGHGKVIS